MADTVLDDHGLEVIRKAGYVDEDGNVRIRTTDGINKKDTLEVVKTTITTSKTRINTPSGSNNFLLLHYTNGTTAYIAGTTVATSGSNQGIPFEYLDVIEFSDMKNEDGNSIYGITASGSVDVYAIGTVTE